MRWEISLSIQRPIEEVWAFIAENFNIPRLGGTTLVVRQTSPGPPGIGATFQARQKVAGFETRLDGICTEWNPPFGSAYSITGSPIRKAIIRHVLEPTSGGTRLLRSVDIEPKWPIRALMPLLGPLLARRWNSASNRLKQLIESQERPGAEPQGQGTTLMGTAVRRTLMFTDIVGSTALVGVIGDAAWKDLRLWHDVTLRRQFASHRGLEVSHTGDGFFVVFESAANALECAIQIQRTLAQHRRAAGFAPTIRTVLHTGDVVPDGSGFAGAAIHLAARLAAVADGGQVIATEGTVREAGTDSGGVPTKVQLRDFGDDVSVVSVPW